MAVTTRERRWRPWLAPMAGVAPVVILGVTLVALSLRQPNIPTYAATTPAPRDTGHALVGPVLYTVDATGADRWRYFSFRMGAVVDDAGPTEWDLAFRRFQVIANGGPGFQARGGIVDLGQTPFDDVDSVPGSGYQVNEAGQDPRNPAIARWYRYGFFSHLLTPKPHVWAVRTADGRYAKIEILGYYCLGPQPGCFTFRYVYQGDGSRVLARPRGGGPDEHR